MLLGINTPRRPLIPKNTRNFGYKRAFWRVYRKNSLLNSQKQRENPRFRICFGYLNTKKTLSAQSPYGTLRIAGKQGERLTDQPFSLIIYISEICLFVVPEHFLYAHTNRIFGGSLTVSQDTENEVGRRRNDGTYAWTVHLQYENCNCMYRHVSVQDRL